MRESLGYTIVEVLIVLAVSGLMFVVAVNFINGKQGRASFTQGTNETVSQIQNVIEQVSDGQYSDIPLNCTFDGTSTTVTGGSRPPGTNSTCIFLGKILRFHNGGDGTYNVLSLAAGRVTMNGAGDAITPTLANTHPVLIDDLTTRQNIAQQLEIRSIDVTDTGGGTVHDAYNFGFAQGLGNVSDGSFQSGAQTINMIYSTANMTDPSTPDSNITGSNLAYARAATICMSDGPRFVRILVGDAANNASQLSVRRQVVTTC